VDGRPGSTKSFFMVTSTVCFHKALKSCTQGGVHVMRVGRISLIGCFLHGNKVVSKSSCCCFVWQRQNHHWLLAAFSLTSSKNRLPFFYFPIINPQYHNETKNLQSFAYYESITPLFYS